MRKLLLALCLWPSLALAQGPPTGPPFQFPCTTNIASSFGVAAVSSAIVGVQGKSIYICGWHASTTNASTAAVTTFQLTYTSATTNNNCLTSTPSSNLTPVNAVTGTAPSVDHNTVASLFVPQQATSVVTPSSVCVTVGGANSLQLLVYYGQY